MKHHATYSALGSTLRTNTEVFRSVYISHIVGAQRGTRTPKRLLSEVFETSVYPIPPSELISGAQGGI